MGCAPAIASATDGFSAANTILLQRYHKLTRAHLDPRATKLFVELTGLQFHVAWAPTGPQTRPVDAVPSQCCPCPRLSAAPASAPSCCATCLRKHLPLALRAGPGGHRFTCPRDFCNFCLRIEVRGLIVGLAFLQTRDDRRPQSRRKFDRAAQLLKLMVRHAETADLAELRKEDRTQARIEAREHEQEEARLRRELRRIIPAVQEDTAVPACLTRAEQVVCLMLECIHQHLEEPVTLQLCASRLGLHASYLSTLFSRTIGLPFKTYVTELRLEQARRLLSDPAQRIAKVAVAVGYTSENRFRAAFKTATGLPPAAWREALQVQPAAKRS